MLHISLGYTFSSEPSAGTQLDNPLFAILAAIHRCGSVAQATQQLGLSYRHVWGTLKNWEAQLGAELVIWNRGKRARLSGFGEKLLFAEQRAKARALPELENLRAGMEREFALAFDPGAHVLSVHASHDLALSQLKDYMAREAKLHLDLRFRPSMEALAALSRGECMLAGFHVSEDRAPGTLTQKAFKKLLKPGKHKLINFISRHQGLMTAPGNPKGISGIPDLKRVDIRFVNRQAGSGTRLEIDQMLERERIAPRAVSGYDHTETTHLAVAAAVASGEADAGIGIAAAAAQFGLHFILLVREQYYFVCLKETLDAPAVIRLRELLRLSLWQDAIASMPGYDTAGTGEVASLRQAMPWYSFRKPKL
ncbi:MAG: substrate-binding domain-containing protein [Noviherbaspirillum sp.]